LASPNADRGKSPTPEAGSVSDKELDYLSEVSRGGERAFAVILLICAYSLLTMGNTTDASLVTNSAMSQLPIINVEVPIVGFYFLVPTLLLGAFIYLHLYLFRLWRGLATLPAIDEKRGRLDDYIRPWLIATGFARSRIPALQTPRQLFGKLESAVSIFLAWWFVPVTMFSFGVRYVARHHWYGTAYQIALLIVVIAAAAISFGYSTRILRGAQHKRKPWARALLAEVRMVELWASLLLAAVTCITAVVVVLIIKGSVFAANLDDAELSRKSAGWTGQCETQKCASLDAEIGSVRGAFLERSDLQRARATRVFLVNADLEEVDLRSAVLTDSRLQGARLRSVRFEDAQLTGVYLDHADLSDAHFEGAFLPGASMGGVKARSAYFDRAYMAGAILDHANLSSAKFSNAYLPGASFFKAILDYGQFQNATLNDARLREAYLQRADMSGAQLRSADLKDVSAPDIILHCADLSEAVLTGANMRHADLTDASLRDANLRNANLWGARFTGAQLEDAEFTGAKMSETDLRGVDLSKANGLTQSQLSEACMDQNTKLPVGIVAAPCPDTIKLLPAPPKCER
jgi:uncharacterized protein YjbI with pentapeptide repeats